MCKDYFDFHFFNSLENTNDKIRKISLDLKKENNHLALFCSYQKKGRGRKNRVWNSSKGDLTCSFLIKKRLNISQTGKINLFITYSLINILRKIGIKNVQFKWPNDIFVEDKKIAGILIESSIYNNYINQYIIGIGLNLIKKTMDTNYEYTSLNQLGKKFEPLKLFFLIVDSMYYYLGNFLRIDFNILSQNISKIFYEKIKPIKINLGKKNIIGKFEKITPSGEIILKDRSEVKTIGYGEII